MSNKTLFENLTDQHNDQLFIEQEVDRINAQPAQGEQSIMVQHDMKKWAVDNEMWPHVQYQAIVGAYADAMGWTQDAIDPMEIV